MEVELMHPKIVHLPIALAVFMPLLAGGVALSWWKGWLPRKTWAIPAIAQLLLVVTGFASMASGEEDEEIVEAVLSHDLIHAHEEAGELFVYMGVAVLVLALAAMFLKKERLALGLAGATTLGSVVVFVLCGQAGSLGGDLVYKHGAANAVIDGAAIPHGDAGHDDHDEDDHH